MAVWAYQGNIRGPAGAPGAPGAAGANGADGPQGIDGPPGPQGPQGATGIQGPTGAQGAQGDTGPTGPQGQGIEVEGSNTWPFIQAIPSPQTGDMWVLTASDATAPGFGGGTGANAGDGLVWSGTAWVNTGPVQGPAGPQGDLGPIGPQGPAGATGATGSVGPAGPTGDTGPQGVAGAQGPQGVPGEVTIADGDARWVNIAGDTMTGNLTAPVVIASTLMDAPAVQIGNAPTAANHATRKDYVDAQRDTRVAKTGDSMSGDLTLAGATAKVTSGAASNLRLNAPSGQSVLLQTADNTRMTISDTGAVLAVPLTLSADPTGPFGAATKQYVDAQVGGRLTQTAADARYLQLSGGTLTGSLSGTGLNMTGTVAGNFIQSSLDIIAGRDVTSAGHVYVGVAPTNPNDATRKDYVDAQVATRLTQAAADALYVSLGGDTMTGPLVLPADPTLALQAATKQYVDTQVATAAPVRQTVTTSAATTKTLALTDENDLLVFTAATAITLTVPLNSSIAFPIGGRVDIAQTGAGKITVAPAGGVTVTATPSLILRAAGSVASLIKIATDAWILTGDLT